MSKSLSRRAAAEYLGVSPGTLANYEKRGIAPCHLRFHGVHRYAVADLDAWRDARTVEGAQ